MPRHVEEFTDVNMSYRDYENWRNETRIATEERHELVEEIRALETERETLNMTLANVRLGWDTCLKYLGESADLNEELRRENRELRAELELEQSRYTLGGVPPGYRPWGNVKLPPPPSAESGRFDGS